MTEQQRGAEGLLARAEALHWFLEAAGGVVPAERLVPARTAVARARERLGLSRGHTVVALAGPTGGGKSSLFNAVCQLRLSPVGVRRPTTGTPRACVWGTEGSTPLLDWLDIPAENRFARESLLDADDEAPLRGLVLIDLPDLDSVAEAHRIEVERLLGLVDLMIWVTDPQKYADQLVHDRYLRAFHRYRDVMVVVLNQADRLSAPDAARCLADLRRLLDADGLAGIPAFATSTVGAPGTGELRPALEQAVGARQVVLRRLDDDLTDAIGGLAGLAGPEPAERGAEEALVDALVHAAGLAAVAETAARAYRRRAGWWLRWLPVRPPWRPPAATAQPVPTQPAAVALAVRAYGQRVGVGLPDPWPAALDNAARSRLADLTPALDRMLARIDLGASRTRWWWPLAWAAQIVLALVALGGLGWYVGGLVAPAFGGPAGGSGIGSAIMAAAALAGGVLLRLLLPPLSVASSRIVQERALRRLRATVFEAAREYVVEPVRGLLGKYARASAALAAAGSVGINDTDNSNDQRRADRARAAGSGVGAGHP